MAKRRATILCNKRRGVEPSYCIDFNGCLLSPYLENSRALNLAIGTEWPATANYPLKTAGSVELWGVFAAPRVLTKMGAAARSDMELYLIEVKGEALPNLVKEHMSERRKHFE